MNIVEAYPQTNLLSPGNMVKLNAKVNGEDKQIWAQVLVITDGDILTIRLPNELGGNIVNIMKNIILEVKNDKEQLNLFW